MQSSYWLHYKVEYLDNSQSKPFAWRLRTYIFIHWPNKDNSYLLQDQSFECTRMLNPQIHHCILWFHNLENNQVVVAQRTIWVLFYSLLTNISSPNKRLQWRPSMLHIIFDLSLGWLHFLHANQVLLVNKFIYHSLSDFFSLLLRGILFCYDLTLIGCLTLLKFGLQIY